MSWRPSFPSARKKKGWSGAPLKLAGPTFCTWNQVTPAAGFGCPSASHAAARSPTTSPAQTGIVTSSRTRG